MTLHWIKQDIAECTRRGIVYFTSELEMMSGLPCKMYRINEDYGSMSDHMHDYFQIWYVRRGEFDHTMGGRKYSVVQGDIVVVPPYCIHRVEMLPGRELEVIGCEFTPGFINEQLASPEEGSRLFDQAFIEAFVAPEHEIPPKIPLSGSSDLAAQELLNEMLGEYSRRSPCFEMLLKANLLKLMMIVNREHDAASAHARPAGGQYHEQMLGAIQFIHQHYDQPLRLEELCSMTMMSRTNFCRHFKEITGRTFSQYVASYRIRMAMKLLTEPELTVTEVCYKVGFNELPYFCRIFKKYTGTTPAYYKKNSDRSSR